MGTDDDGQTVSWQGTSQYDNANRQVDSNITITQEDSSKATDNTITVTGGVTDASITLSGVNIESNGAAALKIGNGTETTNVNIQLDGSNRLVSGNIQAGVEVTGKALAATPTAPSGPTAS